MELDRGRRKRGGSETFNEKEEREGLKLLTRRRKRLVEQYRKKSNRHIKKM